MLRFAVLLVVAMGWACTVGDADEAPRRGRNRHQIIVTPNGPEDGGDFGPRTPGTKTSGLQEALNVAKEQAKDVYLAGGSWTAGKTEPIVYNLSETLHIPWMQNFRLDSGHCVLNYTPKTGDAVVFDSQMSCSYRFGLIVSLSDGAVVRLKPTTAGPDRFKVITSTEFIFNAVVGGGGAWPGGEPYKNELDRSREWKGVGLWLDASEGPIDANKITVIETVGCKTGLLLTGPVSRNTIEEINIHLCSDHLQVGSSSDGVPNANRISAFMDSQGIEPSRGAIVFGHRNMLTLSTAQMSKGQSLVFGASARENIIMAHGSTGITSEACPGSNLVMSMPGDGEPVVTPAVPRSGEAVMNRGNEAVEVLIIQPGKVSRWEEVTSTEERIQFDSPFHAGQTFILRPGESVALTYSEPPSWKWKRLGP